MTTTSFKDILRNMRNRRMAEKVEKGEAISLHNHEKTSEGDYILSELQEGVDYCDILEEHWIWSIGKDNSTGIILASTSSKFYQSPYYTCLFLR